MLKIGIIGAGAISLEHIKGYQNNPNCEIVAIADLNLALAQKRAEEYGIKKACQDYKVLLADSEIDAVSIVTPTFTHKDIVIDALNAGKHVLCEKPPALHADDVRKCAEVAKATGKLLMYAFVCRFKEESQYLKSYFDGRKLGELSYVEAVRTYRHTEFYSWFADRSKSGGFLFDAGIHELDLALYLMGYPKPKTVLGFTSSKNNALLGKVKNGDTYESVDTTKGIHTMESFCGATIILDNNVYLHIKSACIDNCVNPSRYIEFSGTKAGVLLDMNTAEADLKLLELENGYYNKKEPIIQKANAYAAEINHFIDCITNGTECICKPEEAIALIEILNAIYKSAETGKAIEF